MKNILSLMLLSLMLFSCQSYHGNLEVSEETTFSNGNIAVVIPAGMHEMELKFTSKTKGKLIIPGYTKMDMRLKREIKLPSNGNFTITRNDWNLNLEVSGVVETVQSMGELVRTFESCSYQRPRTICNQHGCTTVYETVWGQQDVAYRMRTIVQDMDMAILDDNGVGSNFTSTSTNYQKVYQWQGMCM
jgi:hypothetical protein